ncbi:MAG: tRNA uridine-5-carboxymethylaminomethyl(34) synthesis enzyme MnmG [Bdellovibrionales bacterium]
MSDFDVIVVGAGHAGIEACMATSGLGLQTLLVTTNLDRIGYMSCNPSIGGLAKGHMVRELDVLGGQMAVAADKTCIQYKRLNSSRGPAVRGTRVQNDKHLYNQYMTKRLLNQDLLTVRQGEVKRLILEGSVCRGVVLEDQSEIRSRTVIITAGTFLNGVMHVGLEQMSGGRVGDKAAVGLSDQLKEFGFSVKRLKTGTPPRLLKSSIDWSQTIPQYGDENFFPFSLKSAHQPELPQIACYLSRTTERTHEIIRANLDKSPMYCGVIEGVGPRYCPSIEDKVMRFADRDSHQTFLEPEGLTTDLIYLQGISTSLPVEVQDEFLRTIPGLENVSIVRPGYAVEYDYIEPTQIWHTLQTRTIHGLFLAGQINGTSGYEEAAVQGFVAGVNAAHRLLERDEFILGRDQAYIGVLIDDLVTKGTREPYRMFTSRAEHRLVLREDNTLDRLAPTAEQLGLVHGSDLDRQRQVVERRRQQLEYLRATKIFPNAEVQAKLASRGLVAMNKSLTLEEFLRRTDVSPWLIRDFGFEMDLDPLVAEAVEIEVKYAGYVRRQLELIDQAKKQEELVLPAELDYKLIRGLSKEEMDKLDRVRPRTLGQAQRISGVNPSAVQAIMIHLKGRKLPKENLLERGSDISIPPELAN